MKLAVLGDPLRFTLSPVLHRAGLAAIGIDAESIAIRTPLDDVATQLAALRDAGYRGTNVTSPLKAAVIPHLDRISPDAERLHSVNTIGFERGVAWGDTTDGAGFLAALEREGLRPSGQRVVILGAGGAARCVAGAVAPLAASLHLATREPGSHTAALSASGLPAALAFPSTGFADALAESTLVVQATPESGLDGPFDPARVPAGAVAVDLRYGAEPTPWVAALRFRGVRAMDGLGMLIHQARASLRLWTGREIPLEALEAAVGWPR
jgi:shikimate dehydrogenase